MQAVESETKPNTVERDPDAYFRGKPGPGRPKGLQSTDTRKAREALAAVFERADGLQRLYELVTSDDPSDRRVFWTMWTRCFVPQLTELDGKVDVTLHSGIASASTALPSHVVRAGLEAMRAALAAPAPAVIDVEARAVPAETGERTEAAAVQVPEGASGEPQPSTTGTVGAREIAPT